MTGWEDQKTGPYQRLNRHAPREREKVSLKVHWKEKDCYSRTKTACPAKEERKTGVSAYSAEVGREASGPGEEMLYKSMRGRVRE
jgi:hypothetical protein